MCLEKKRFTFPERASEDIVVYKIFIPDAFIIHQPAGISSGMFHLSVQNQENE